ncbi:MAG TPA: hypothetical protein PKC28_14910 [Bdellovibrionales bacterium]|nr:hypothetical protein [Bdellovibrionales bacterium]
MRSQLVTGSVIASLLLTGCGQGFKGTAGTVSSGSQSLTVEEQVVNVENEMRKAEEASVKAQEAMIEADRALSEITDEKGNINLGLFSKTKTSEVQSQFLLKGVMDKLRGVFDKVFARVETVKAKFDAARTALNDALNKLEASNPAHAALIAEIRTKLIAVDVMEGQFRNGMHLLAGKLDLAIVGLDKLVQGVTSFIPGWGFVVNMALDYLVMSDVKQLIGELKARLLAI